MFHKVKDIQPLDEFNLLVIFQNGEKKKYDVRPLFEKWDAFRMLASTVGLFRQVKVDVGGYGISWNDELDLACNELYYNGISFTL